ncbi:restriction endonuclease, partial [Candidatus Nomurabacteria bacterium]|nr:restriction endonuclease [Candidatus Nomurabacteria bacterium]
MNFPGINIQGNIVSSEILEKIRSEDIKFQTAADFKLDRKTSVRDEIGIAWAAARAHYTAFRLRIDRLKEGDTGTSETRNSWIIPLLRELGYNVEKASAFIHPTSQKSYAISHLAANLDAFPIHIMGFNDDLDKRREAGGPRLSPHALVQEYLNNTEHVYALVTNGRFLRLLRDATRLVRISYLEFNLEKIMEEELYSDFAIFFRLLHATRMPQKTDEVENSYIEYYHQESLASGSRIREKLSKAVEDSIKELANGFLRHPKNTLLREQITNDSLKPASYYLYQLRLIYRLLSLIREP